MMGHCFTVIKEQLYTILFLSSNLDHFFKNKMQHVILISAVEDNMIIVCKNISHPIKGDCKQEEG